MDPNETVGAHTRIGMNGALVEHLAPDSIRQIMRAAESRYQAALILASQEGHRLTALYLFGFSAEMWLSAACFRAAGFNPEQLDQVRLATLWLRQTSESL